MGILTKNLVANPMLCQKLADLGVPQPNFMCWFKIDNGDPTQDWHLTFARDLVNHPAKARIIPAYFSADLAALLNDEYRLQYTVMPMVCGFGGVVMHNPGMVAPEYMAILGTESETMVDAWAKLIDYLVTEKLVKVEEFIIN